MIYKGKIELLLRIFSILCLFFLLSSAYGQENDSVISPKKNVKFFFGLDARTSAILNQKASMGGFKIGAEVDREHRFGLCMYFLQDDIVRTNVRLDREKYPESTDTSYYHFSYVSMFYEYVWFKRKRWEFSSPVQLGVAGLDVDYQNLNKERVKYFEGNVFVTSLASEFEFKPLRWLGVGAGVGYRRVLSSDKRKVNSLSAPFYAFKLKIKFGIIYKLLAKKPIDDGWDEE